MAEAREAVGVAARRAGVEAGWSLSRMKKSAVALPGAPRAMEIAPATLCRPVLLLGSSAIGG